MFIHRFKLCVLISFLKRFGSRCIVCFDSLSVSLAFSSLSSSKYLLQNPWINLQFGFVFLFIFYRSMFCNRVATTYAREAIEHLDLDSSTQGPGSTAVLLFEGRHDTTKATKEVINPHQLTSFVCGSTHGRSICVLLNFANYWGISLNFHAATSFHSSTGLKGNPH